MLLRTYIDREYNGNISELAREIGTYCQLISHWVKQDYIVVDRMVYKPARKLPEPFKQSHQYRKMSPKKSSKLFVQHPRGVKYADN